MAPAGPRRNWTRRRRGEATARGRGAAAEGSGACARAQLRELERALAECLLRDRTRLARQLRRLQSGPADPPRLERLARAVSASAAHCRRRRASVPAAELSQELPIAAQQTELAEAIAANQVVVVCGETGSGKSTQLPKLCLALGRGVAGSIGLTQPRRIAARSIATRIAAEIGTPLGTTVGYRVRFDERVGADTLVKVLTDGMLLAEIESDRRLEQYDTLIVDEAHERSLNIDFLLGYLKQLLPRRQELKLIITSATIDPQRFSRHFDNAPIIEVSGRVYPVEVRYRPYLGAAGDDDDKALAHLWSVVEEAMAEGSGDIMLFQPGEREIRESAEYIARQRRPDVEVLPLYARLPTAQQERIFKPHRKRRLVIATNVAETSLTVPGIRFVIDTGLARVSRYSPARKIERLPVEPISQAAAKQRQGRCGRVRSGVCFRLYSEEDFHGRSAYTDAEILRASLAGVILRMHALGLGDVGAFAFVDPPLPKQVNDGYLLLQELGAVDAERRLTDLGRRLAKLPVDARVARMLVAGSELGCLGEVLVIAAALSIQDPRVYPFEQREAARRHHATAYGESSDFLALLELWRSYHEQRGQTSRGGLRAFCKENFLSPARMREWIDLHRHLADLARELGLRANRAPAGADAVHKALLTGLLGNVASRRDDGQYQATRGRRLAVFPGSVLAGRTPRWIVAAELVETGRLYARTLAGVKVAWIERAAAQQLKRTYSEPRWERSAGRVIAFEHVTLYGLTLVARRRISYSAIDARRAREVFIRDGLVPGELDVSAPFMAHNREQLACVRQLEHRLRCRDILDDGALFDFYDGRLPAGVSSGAELEAWRAQAERERPRLLFIDRARLMRRQPTAAALARFPERLRAGGLALELEHRFEPGGESDGVTAKIPLAALNQLAPSGFDRVVPGLLREKVLALMKSLPKTLRRRLVPVPDNAERVLARVAGDPRPLTTALGEALRELVGVDIDAAHWDEDALPEHLRMRFSVVDADGGELACGRDLIALQARLGKDAEASFARVDAEHLERVGITRWTFGDLPGSVELAAAGPALVGYPALLDCGDSVAVRVLDSPERARNETREGLQRLFLLSFPEHRRFLEKGLPGIDRLCLLCAALGTCRDLRRDVARAALERALFAEGELEMRQAEFERRAGAAAAALAPIATQLCDIVGAILAAHREARALLASEGTSALHEELEEQLHWLVFPGFVSRTPPQWLGHVPRYLAAVCARLRKAQAAPERDRERAALIAPLWQRYRAHAGAEPPGAGDEALVRYRWMIEELRVSVFAQELGTALPVSAKRLERQWQRALTQTSPPAGGLSARA